MTYTIRHLKDSTYQVMRKADRWSEPESVFQSDLADCYAYIKARQEGLL